MTDSSKYAKDLESILNELDSVDINELTEEEIIEYRRQLNPYGRIIAGSDKILTFSYTNLKEKYMEKLLMTGLIGYLNRACDEYHVPDGIPVIPVYDFVQKPELLEEYHQDWNITDAAAKDIQENREWMYKRVIIKEFLEEMFQYNPDKHVRSVYKPQPKDVARGIIDTPAANLAINQLKKKDSKFREQMLEFDRVQKLINMKEGSGEKVDESITQLVGKKIVLPQEEEHYANRDYENASAEDQSLIKTVCYMIPPTDIYHKFRNYFETNYDKLRESVQYLYCEKADLDIAICPHNWHDTEEEADDYIKKHRSEVITDIMKGHSGKWNIHAPFEKVRESMKFFNENTIVLEEIANQIEADAKIGSELMKNRIKIKKKQNIEEEGEEAALFKEWRNNNTTLKDMGAITLDKDDLAASEAPDDSICVPVLRMSKGGLKFTKDYFYSKSVAPDVQQQE
jgi:hypothetical protein